jgi:two-component system response regulator GlrR
MENEKILLLDFHAEGQLGAALRDILSSCLAEGITLVSEDAGFDTTDSPGEQPAYLGLIAAHEPVVTYLLLSERQLGRLGALTEALKPRWPGMPVIVIAEGVEPTRIYELLQDGVTDFIAPPLRAVEILPRFWRLLEHARRKRTTFHALKEELGLGQLIGESPSFLAEVRKIPLIARCDASVLITGETGTGKELCARAIHYLSPRSDRPFVPINCGAIPVELMENELFGHERGAFTGAARAQSGVIQSADGGMLFLDEVDSLSLPAQVKLLRFLQEKEYRPLGSARTQRADVRVVAATNGDCEQLAAAGKLRPDLYHRLNVIPLRLPPLRERRGDIALLARHFLEQHAADAHRPAPELDDEAMLVLTLYDWPGHVREF